MKQREKEQGVLSEERQNALLLCEEGIIVRNNLR